MLFYRNRVAQKAAFFGISTLVAYGAWAVVMLIPEAVVELMPNPLSADIRLYQEAYGAHLGYASLAISTLIAVLAMRWVAVYVWDKDREPT